MDDLVTVALSQPAWLVYLAVAALVYLETAVVLGAVVPGETAALVAGVTVAVGHTSLVATAVVVVLAALLGDTTAYLLGRSAGSRWLAWRGLSRVRRRVEAAQSALAHRGAVSLVPARFTPVARTVAPMLAGSGGLAYRTFLRWNGMGVVAWGVGCVGLGAVVGRSWDEVSGWLGAAGLAVLGVGLVVWIAVRALRRRRRERLVLAGLEDGALPA